MIKGICASKSNDNLVKIASFSPLPHNSQAGEDVLFIKTNAPLTDLYEALTLRLSVASEMLYAVASTPKNELNAIPIASAAAILLSDAEGMLTELYDHIKRQQEIRQAGVNCTACLRAATED